MSNLKASVLVEFIDKITAPLKEVKKSISSITKAQDNLTSASNNASKSLEHENNELENTGKVAKKTKSSIDNLIQGTAQSLAGLGIASKLKNSLNVAGLRETLNLDLATVLGSGLEVSKFKSFFEKIEQSGIACSKELAQTSYNLLSAGLSTSEALKSSKIVAEVSKITKGNADSIASIMATASKNFEVDMVRVGDVLTKTQIKFQFSNFNTLGEGFANASASASAMKMSIEETATALGILNDAGVTGANAGTSLSAVLRQMPTAIAGMKLANPYDREGKLDFGKFLKSVNEVAKGMSTLEKSQTLQKYFGYEGKKVLLPMLLTLSEYDNKLKDVTENSKNIVNEKAKAYYATLNVKVAGLSSSFSRLASTIGTAVLPSLISLIDFISPIINGFSNLIEKHEWLGSALFYSGSALATFITVAGGLAILRGLGISVSVFTGFVGVLGKTALFSAGLLRILSVGFINLGIAIMSTPLGWILGALALIGGGAYLLIRYFKPAGTFFASLWNTIKVGMKSVYSWLMKYIIEPISGLWDKISGVFGGNKATIESKHSNKTIVEEVKANKSASKSAVSHKQGNTIFNNTFNISGSNLNAKEIADMVISKLKEQNKYSLS